MVLLDMCVKKFGRDNVVVAHFDHCTRPSSETDRMFVQKFCLDRGIKCESKRTKREMSEHLPEKEARNMRYNFFAQVREKYGANEIWVAHHLDDLVESVAINLLRGTGWRGLSVMNSSGVKRPLIDGEFGRVYDKRDILKYAADNGVCYRQDPTNTEDIYLRNRVRRVTFELPREVKDELWVLRSKQCKLRVEVAEAVDTVIGLLVGNGEWREVEGTLAVPRGVFGEMDDAVAMEVIEVLVKERLGAKCTRPQLRDFLGAIREYAPGKVFNLPRGKLVRMGREFFVI